MPRKKYWRRGMTNKKGNSHPSNKGLTIDVDQVKPPVKKVSDDQVKPPVKKGIETVWVRPHQRHFENLSENLLENLSENLSENLPENLLENLSEYCSENCSEHCQQLCHKSSSNSTQKSSLQNIQKSLSEIFHNTHIDTSHDTVFASHNQADSRYSSFSRGSQCTCMALSIVLNSFENFEFSPAFLDRVLLNGDNLYRKTVMDLQKEGKFRHKLLSYDELPESLEFNNELYNITKHTVIYGLPVIEVPRPDVPLFSLQDALVLGFSKSDYLLIIIGAICSALFRLDEKYVFFDSHSHGSNGLSGPDGKAVMIVFDTIDNVITYLYAFYLSANIELSSQFEVLPVSIQRVAHSFPDFDPNQRPQGHPNVLLGSLNKNRKDGSVSATEENAQRNNYMKTYMQRKRLNKQYRENERQKEVVSKHRARQDVQYRQSEKQKELDSKQKARQDKEFRQKEAVWKRTARLDVQYRQSEKQKELDSKQKARQDKEFRQKEAVGKRTARLDVQYRQSEKQKELDSKQKARQDKEFRQKEAVKKRTARLDVQYRQSEKQKELDSKQKARQDKEFRQKEAVKKRTARLDVQYRQSEKQKEVLNKHKARQNVQYRQSEKQKEVLNKRKARQNVQYRQSEKQKEVLNKRKARQNVQYRQSEKQKEVLNKRKARQNVQYRQSEKQRELVSKHIARKSDLFVEGERLRKQESRRDHRRRAVENEANRSRKAQKRKNSDYAQAEYVEAKRKKCGADIEDCINKFHTSIKTGPAFVCTCCHQTWFSQSVSQVTNILVNSHPEYFTGFSSVQNREWICRTCSSSLKKDKVPKLSVVNGMKWPVRPNELRLHPLEERLVSLRIPFMQIRELPRGGQYCVKGNVVNVPVDIQPTVNALPRQMDDNFTIPVKLKKKLSYKTCDFTENVRPSVVLSALHWLMNSSEMYINSGVHIDETWIQSVSEDAREIVREFTENIVDKRTPDACEDENEKSINKGNMSTNDKEGCTQNPIENKDGHESDNFSEIDANENVQGTSDTLLEEESVNTDRSYTFAPGEGQHPLSLYSDKDAEFLSFPTIFCGQRRIENKDRNVPVHYSDIAKWELRSVDRRAAQSVPNIFFKLKKIQLKQISDKVHLAVRRCKTKGKKITAAEARDHSNLERLVRLDEGYYIFRQLRNSPAYLAAKKKDVFAMIRQLGLPTWFMSLSSADTRWPDLLKILAKLNCNLEYTDEEIHNMTWLEKTKLIQKDPVTSSRFFDHRVQQFISIVLKSPHAPIGKVTDFFYRVEFQQRGSPHIHMLVWVENSPSYQKDTEQEIEDYVDKYVTCSKDQKEMEQLVNMQTHKHSKTCRKKGKAVCRFGFPLPPLKKTMLLEPLECDIDKYKKMYDKMQEKINNFKDGLEMTFDQFLNEVIQMTEDEYIKCIRSSLRGPKVFLKRQPAEMRVNLYNEYLLTAWNANMDLQFVLDPFACVMYIVSYISKSQRGMSALLDRACKEARQGNMDIKKQVRHIGNKFLNSVEVGAQEACYLVLQMPLTKCTREVMFINTSPPSERVFLLKQQSKLEEMRADSTDISCENIIQRYSKRPRALENWCLADYCSELNVVFPDDDDEKVNSNDNNDDELPNQVDDNDDESFTDESTLLTLRNGIKIKRRTNPRVLRYVHYNIKIDPENYYRERLLLFLPWRNELADLLGGCSCYKDHYESHRHMVDSKAKKYEHHVDEIEQARQAVEEEMDEHDELAPNAQQANAEDELQGQQDTDEFVHFNPDRPVEQRQYDIGLDVGASTNSSTVTDCVSGRLSDEDYRKLARSLNARQREFFNHVLHWVKTKDEPLYAFLSGGAGVGKSVLIKALYQALHRYLHSAEGEDPDDTRILLCAFTGKAAYNINGVTIASAFHKKYNQLNQSMNSDELNTFRMKYRNLSVIIIDEISMVGNKMLNFIDTRLKELTGTNRPFGGISIIAVGDLFQLQPVGDSWIFRDLSDGTQILATNLWKEHFKMYELTQIMRQRDDLYFADFLNRLRVNELTEDDKNEIKQHIVSHSDVRYPQNAPHLFIENKFVDSFNEQFMTRLSSCKITVQSHDSVVADLPKSTKDRLLNSLPKDASKTANLAHSLTVAEGMIYDITVNLDVNDGLANGSTCTVKCIEYRMQQNRRPSIIWVLFTDSSIGSATRQKYRHLYSSNVDPTWTPVFEVNRNFLYNYKSFQRIQFPLKPAAAKTVHKAQGCTVDELVIDLSQSHVRKTPHIHYVALSRVRKLQNLHILNFNEDALTVDDRVKIEMDRLRRESQMPLCFIPLYNKDPNTLKVALNNARSLHRHFVDLAVEPTILSADIVGITESRLVPADEDFNYTLQGYKMLRNDQVIGQSNRRPSHGLVLYIKHDFVAQRVVKHTTTSVEFLLVDLHCDKYDYIQVVVMYKTPSCSVNEFMQYVNQYLKPKLDIHRPFLIMGDFNSDIMNGNMIFLEFMMQTFSCVQHVQTSTTDYGSQLDLVFSNFADILTGTVECYWSDHKIVHASLPCH